MSKDYKAYAAKQLAGIYEVNDYERVLQALKEADIHFADVVPATFGLEFLAARLALAAHGWSRACKENHVEEKGAENYFFKAVMQSFQTSKFVDIAGAFSEYLHAPAVEEKPVLSISAMMMKRLGLAGSLLKGQEPVLTTGFRLLVETAESFKSGFENEFFDFAFSDNPR